MNLRDTFPHDEIIKRCEEQIKIEEYDISRLSIIEKLNSGNIIHAAYGCWHRLYASGIIPEQDKQWIGLNIKENTLNIFSKLEQFLGIKILKDFYWCTVTTNSDFRVAEYSIVTTHQDFCFLADVLFQNPHKRINDPWKQKEFLCEYRGFGLLKEVMKNLKAFARKYSYKKISLTALTESHTNLFARFGFEVEWDYIPPGAREMGLGLPMVLNL